LNGARRDDGNEEHGFFDRPGDFRPPHLSRRDGVHVLPKVKVLSLLAPEQRREVASDRGPDRRQFASEILVVLTRIAEEAYEF
jgi:hypothetical protein